MVLQLKTDAVFLFHDFSQKTSFFFLVKKTQKIYFQYMFWWTEIWTETKTFFYSN